MKSFSRPQKILTLFPYTEVDIESRMTLNKCVAPRLNDTICFKNYSHFVIVLLMFHYRKKLAYLIENVLNYVSK